MDEIDSIDYEPSNEGEAERIVDLLKVDQRRALGIYSALHFICVYYRIFSKEFSGHKKILRKFKIVKPSAKIKKSFPLSDILMNIQFESNQNS